MQWLNVPHLKQAKPGWCLPACVSMISAYLEQPLLQDDVAGWLVHNGLNRPMVQPSESRTRLEPEYYWLIYAAMY